jgi:uncharacterized protein (TIGR02271 family)
MSYSSTSGTRRTITAFFDSRSDANEAIERLVKAGIARGEISLVAGGEGGTTPAGATTSGAAAGGDYYARSWERNEGMGWWETLKELFLPDEDRYTYAEGLRRGGFLVTVHPSEAQYERALDILDDEGTIDIEQRAVAWRKEGWTGYSGSEYARGTTGAMASGAIGAAASTTTGLGTGGAAAGRSGFQGAGAGGAATARTNLGSNREEVIPVTEEHLKVGKRDVSHGRVRVRSYVVETPVQEQVNLRQEHVSVERRPVDRPAGGADNLFRERTIEAEEKAEEAVVAKEARVKEELVVKKGVEQRTETVSDKVRRTEVEVEDERNKALRSGERNKR